MMGKINCLKCTRGAASAAPAKPRSKEPILDRHHFLRHSITDLPTYIAEMEAYLQKQFGYFETGDLQFAIELFTADFSALIDALAVALVVARKYPNVWAGVREMLLRGDALTDAAFDSYPLSKELWQFAWEAGLLDEILAEWLEG